MASSILSPTTTLRQFEVCSPKRPSPASYFIVVRLNIFTQRPYLDSDASATSEEEALHLADINDRTTYNKEWVADNPVIGVAPVELNFK